MGERRDRRRIVVDRRIRATGEDVADDAQHHEHNPGGRRPPLCPPIHSSQPPRFGQPGSDLSRSPESPLGDSLDVFLRREDAERFVEAIRGDEPELAEPLRIEERELEKAA
jgi:hypothetical protein